MYRHRGILRIRNAFIIIIMHHYMTAKVALELAGGKLVASKPEVNCGWAYSCAVDILRERKFSSPSVVIMSGKWHQIKRHVQNESDDELQQNDVRFLPYITNKVRAWLHHQDYAQPNLRCNFNEEKPWQCPGEVVNTALPSDFMVYSRFLVPDSPLLVPCLSIVGSRIFSVFGPLHGMTFSFFCNRNPLWTPSSQTSKQFFSQHYRPAMCSILCCCLHEVHLSQVSVCCLFSVV